LQPAEEQKIAAFGSSYRGSVSALGPVYTLKPCRSWLASEEAGTFNIDVA